MDKVNQEEWLFINTKQNDPYFNMAMDEALLNFVAEGQLPPVIRFYGWNPATLSIGYFQKLKKEIDIEKVKAEGYGLVRRATGGRGVLHDKELTYSVIVPESHPAMPQTVTEAYRVISEGLLEGFKALGFDAYFAIPKTEEQRAKLKDPRSSVCFDAPSWYELVVEGRKIAGSAQTRQKGVILQHGSILQSIDVDALFDLFIYGNPRLKEKMKQAFYSKAVSIQDLTDKEITIEMMEAAFYKGFEKGLNIKLIPYEVNKALIEETEKLIEKYKSDDWTYRK
ncbi:biotin/lipoate A/B protein ligase family protein [Macrococcus capreoli]|uniref:lipoate--protein ligase family protein n=1 Tax=Macrococcus capreoli TaxID=2982690 RepID=UPI0021D59BC3|nr:biotin/lipoate A/B protein ligase family protein [Macrococcus sp. TMW 2.2395]MCU7556825.1 lipoate--protein ligase family protein [Macrococcus sp. TMW 2.2395]